MCSFLLSTWNVALFLQNCMKSVTNCVEHYPATHKKVKLANDLHKIRGKSTYLFTCGCPVIVYIRHTIDKLQHNYPSCWRHEPSLLCCDQFKICAINDCCNCKIRSQLWTDECGAFVSDL